MISPSTRIPPHDVDAESALIGSIILDPERVLWICGEKDLTEDAFYSNSHRAIYRTVESMLAAGDPIDILTVGGKLRTQGILDAIGGAVVLDQLVDSVATTAHSGHYAEIVADAWAKRNLLARSIGISEAVYNNPDTPAPEHIATAQNEILALQAKRGQRSHKEVLATIDESLVAAHEGRGGGLPCPWQGLQRLWGGPQKRLVTLICARKRTGKSTMLGQWIYHLAHDLKMPVLVAPLEDGPEHFFRRMAGLHGGWSAFNAGQGRLTQFQFEKAREDQKHILSLPIHFVDGRCRMGDLAAYAVQCKARHGIGAVFVDAFKDILTAGKTLEDDNQLSSELCALADRIDVPVIVTAHLRKVEDNSVITLGDVRGSSRITDDAKLILALQKTGDQYAFDVVANNHGPEGSIPVHFQTGPERFVEATQHKEDHREGF